MGREARERRGAGRRLPMRRLEYERSRLPGRRLAEHDVCPAEGDRSTPVGVVSSSDSSPPKEMTVRGAIFLGVGAMVGAGIFALLGEAGAVAGSAVWVSFLIAGLISGLLGYAVVKLGVRFPSSGGILTYLIEGFGNGRLVGIASWLGYFSAILLVCSMVAVSFGDYATSLLIGTEAAAIWPKLFASAVVLAMAVLNVVGARGVDKAQSVIVVALLAVFAVFIIATLTELNPHLLAPSGYPSLRAIIASVALTFFAYLGFSVISFAAGDLPDPERNLPRAMYVALGGTTALYIAISVGVFGTAHGGRGHEVWGHRGGRGCPACTCRRLHRRYDRRAACNVVFGKRHALRVEGLHRNPRSGWTVPAAVWAANRASDGTEAS